MTNAIAIVLCSTIKLYYTYLIQHNYTMTLWHQFTANTIHIHALWHFVQVCQFQCIFNCIKILLDLFCSCKIALFIFITWCSVLIVYPCVFVWMFVFVLCIYECVWVHLYVCWSQTPSAANQHCPHTCHHPHNLRTRQAGLGLWLIIIIIIK